MAACACQVSLPATADSSTEQPLGTTAAAAADTPAPEQQQEQQQVIDKLTWWGEVAKEAYAAVDGCLEGWEDSKAVVGDAAASSHSSGPGTTGLSAAEAAMVEVSFSARLVICTTAAADRLPFQLMLRGRTCTANPRPTPACLS
jgi:uncharacterized protein YdhG (YjbR/CyaY superfamily)